MVAINVGRSLYADRKLHTVVLLDNATDVPFITPISRPSQPLVDESSREKKPERNCVEPLPLLVWRRGAKRKIRIIENISLDGAIQAPQRGRPAYP
jgi:hypothetical protein